MASAGPATGQRSGAYLTDVCGLLWPPPASATLTRRAGGSKRLIVLPGARAPKLILPAGRKAASTAIRRYGEPGSAKAKVATRVLAGLLASGLGPVVGGRLAVDVPEGAQTIETYLAGQLGQPVEIGLHVGAARANRKPVLQLLSRDGQSLGFAKIGINSLTTGLVKAERAALTQLRECGLTGMRLPEVVAGGTWNGLEVLVLSPLPVWQRRTPLTPDRLAGALTELARATGTSSAPLTASACWRQLLARAAQVDASDDGSMLADLLERFGAAAGPTKVTFGCWHGDLTPWNLASTQVGLLVWDWERFGAGVPIGYDALHYWLQAKVVDAKVDPQAAATRCVAAAATLLAPFGVSGDAARLTVLGYLAELSVRYLTDRQAQAGARLGRPGTWLLPALKTGIDQL